MSKFVYTLRYRSQLQLNNCEISYKDLAIKGSDGNWGSVSCWTNLDPNKINKILSGKINHDFLIKQGSDKEQYYKNKLHYIIDLRKCNCYPYLVFYFKGSEENLVTTLNDETIFERLLWDWNYKGLSFSQYIVRINNSIIFFKVQALIKKFGGETLEYIV